MAGNCRSTKGSREAQELDIYRPQKVISRKQNPHYRQMPAVECRHQTHHERGQSLCSRRAIIRGTLTSAVVLSLPFPSDIAEALPLAPLGGFKSTGDKAHLTVNDIKDVLERDLKEGQYFVTGDLTPDIFDDDCRFKDPTNDIRGLTRYLKALTILFDPQYSGMQLLSIEVVDDLTIQASWILGGYLRFPWNPKVEPFKGTTQWTISRESGLIVMQDQEWSKSATTALLESFTPTFSPPSKLV